MGSKRRLMWSGSRGLLLGFIIALILAYVFGAYGGGGPPYPGVDGFTRMDRSRSRYSRRSARRCWCTG